ncbi:MAG: HEPN domain-containing protein [Victivallaceae bacterium]|nr:HEPN domain-containing protein [Victivallaceae bacterium]
MTDRSLVLDNFEYNLNKNDYKIAAFMLHQAAERFYTTLSLVFTGYKPKLHDLEELDARAQALSDEFKNIFPGLRQRQKISSTG